MRPLQKGNAMHPVLAKLKAQAEENPILAVGAGAAAVSAVAKLIDSLASVRSKQAYAKRMKAGTKK